MTTIVTRTGKGSSLTWAEMDANFTNLNTAKAEVDSPTFTGTVTTAAFSTTGTATLANLAVSGMATFTTLSVSTLINVPTASQFDNSTRAASTAFVKTQSGNFSGFQNITSATTLTAANAGMLHYCAGSAAYTVTLPSASAVSAGTTIVVVIASAYTITLSRAGTDLIYAGTTSMSTLAMSNAATVEVVSDGISKWVIEDGTVQIPYASLASLTVSGLILGYNNISVGSVGCGLRVKEGTNGKQGVATLVAGTVTVACTTVTATSRIFLTSQADGGTPGWLRVSARTAGTSFTITSSSASDTSTVAYQIFEPA